MIALLGLSTVTFTSCSSDDDCPIGMTGKNCDEEIRTPMLGEYRAVDVNNNNANDEARYDVVLKTGASVTVVNIQGFGDFFTEIVTSNVQKNGDNISFTIPAQDPDGDNYFVSGAGEYNAKTKTISITYSLDNGSQVLNYAGEWTKK